MTVSRLPAMTTIRPGCLEALPNLIRSLASAHTPLVVDPGQQSSKWPDRSSRALRGVGTEVAVFDTVEANPRTTTAEEAARMIEEAGSQVVVGIGGGSVLDTAKAAATLATNQGPAESFEGKSTFSKAPLPMIAIPSTCGTGSEVTWVSVLSHEPTGRKISVKGEAMLPDFALVDAGLIATLPLNLVASAG